MSNATLRPAVAGPLEPSVGRPVDEATDAEGPRGTYGCACKDRDAGWCASLRYGSLAAEGWKCECLCHQWSDDDDEYQ